MYEFTTAHDQFSSEEEALALAESRGLTAMALDLTPSGEDHWHDFAADVFVVEGSVKITSVDTGEWCELTAGSWITGGTGAIHREEGEPYRAVVGFHADPATLTMPIDKAPADRPS